MLLLAAVLCLNYVDRGVLPSAAHLIQEDLHLTGTQLGLLLSAFFWTYTLAQIPVGWLAERYGAHRVLAAGLALWAVSTLLVGFVSGFLLLLLLRLPLGVGESVGFPCTSKILAQTVPQESLGTANGIIAFAYLAGPALGLLIGGVLMQTYGWRAPFVFFGTLSLFWLWPWSKQKFVPVAVEERVADTASMRQIFRQPALWGSGLGHFATNYTFYFMLSWLPVYLVTERGFTTLEMAKLTSSAYLLNAVCAVGGGWLLDRYIVKGGSANVIYKWVMGTTQLGFIVCMLCMAGDSRNLALLGLFGFQALCGIQSPGVFAVSQIMAGPAATGRWVGIQNAIGNLAGIIAPALTGFLLDTTGRFTMPFVASAAVGVLGFVGWVILIPRIAQIEWERPAQNS